MTSSNREAVERHIKTHSVRSNEDRSAVNILQAFLRSDGKINPILHIMTNGQTLMEHSNLFQIQVFQEDQLKTFLFKLRGAVAIVKVTEL